MKSKLFFFFFLIKLSIFTVDAQVVSPFNKLSVTDSSSDYTIIVSGHFHGASTNTSTFPAATLLANLDTLNSLHASFMICLGDMFLDVNDAYLEHYQRSLFSKLKMPLFNAVGNHDLSNGNMYERTFGKTYYYFRKGAEVFIILNSELNDGSIKGEQLAMLKNAITESLSKGIKNIFVFSHRPVWAEESPKYSKLFRDNTRTAVGKNNFSTEIEPILKAVAKKKNVFWISGSMGGGPASFFYDKDEDSQITYMQTAIRDLPRDAVLLINFNHGVPEMKGISLTGENLLPVQKYNTGFWNSSVPEEKKFNYRLLPLIISKAFLHIYFWTGFIMATVIVIIVSMVKKWKRRK